MKEGEKKLEIKMAYSPKKVEGKTVWLKKYIQTFICVKIPVKVILKYQDPDTKKFTTKTIYDLIWQESNRKLISKK